MKVPKEMLDQSQKVADKTLAEFLSELQAHVKSDGGITALILSDSAGESGHPLLIISGLLQPKLAASIVEARRRVLAKQTPAPSESN